MKYGRAYAGLRLKPSAVGLLAFTMLTRDTRATLVGIEVKDRRRIRIRRDGRATVETWYAGFWIPLRGNRQWWRIGINVPAAPGSDKS